MKIEKHYYLQFSDGMYLKRNATKKEYTTPYQTHALKFDSEEQLFEFVNTFFKTTRFVFTIKVFYYKTNEPD